MDKLTRQETVKQFLELSKKFGVLDYSKSSDTHDRIYLGKLGNNKARFLAYSRVDWVCVYVDKPEKILLEKNGFPCEKVLSSDKSYDYKSCVDAQNVASFLELVNDYLH